MIQVFFVDGAEVHDLVGGILRLAGEHPVVGPRLAAAATVFRLEVAEPSCQMTVALTDPVDVVCGECDLDPDVTFYMTGDQLDRYWRGEYDLLQGLARGEVEASGRVSRVLKVLPELRLLFPVYRAMAAASRRPRTVSRALPI